MKAGDKFKLNFEVSEKIYSGFMDLFKDRNPLHVDDNHAAEKGFKEKVMYGNILNGFISYFIGEGLPEKNVALIAQDITYMKPVYMNDALELQAEITDVHDSVGMAEFKYVFINAQGTKVAKGKIQIKLI